MPLLISVAFRVRAEAGIEGQEISGGRDKTKILSIRQISQSGANLGWGWMVRIQDTGTN